jgi:hypothetical protein
MSGKSPPGGSAMPGTASRLLAVAIRRAGAQAPSAGGHDPVGLDYSISSRGAARVEVIAG